MKSLFSALIIGCYILCCLLIKTRPWRYFQINARMFSRDKGIFSKLQLDELIPEQWRLRQARLDINDVPESFPVFIKPEWGQNSIGIERADNAEQFSNIARRLLNSGEPHIVQQAATGKREFEIFSTFANRNAVDADILTVTETVNDTHQFPINSIYNENTSYKDVTHLLSEADLDQLVKFKLAIGHFGQSRLSVRADSIAEMIAGNFHVIEINLFTPMPINLMDESHSLMRKLGFIVKVSRSLARATRAIDSNQKTFPVYTSMVLYNHQRNPLGAMLRNLL